MNKHIFPCLWFDGNAKEAAELYCGIFGNSKITVDTPMVVQFEIENFKVMGLNGGPMYKITPSISLFVTCETDEEIQRVWDKLSEGGTAMMPLDKYPWSEKYGWVKDRFGMTWQLMLGQLPPGGEKIIPNFLFVGDQCGKAREAIEYWTSILPDSKVFPLQLYEEGGAQPAGNLMFGHFSLSNCLMSAMDGTGEHAFTFSEGLSILVECDTQEQIDHYWNKLTEGGKESMCGWLKDRYGVSWQIVPKVLGKLMTDPEKGGRAMQALMKMKKLDIAALQNA